MTTTGGSGQAPAALRREVVRLVQELYDSRITDKEFFRRVEAMPVGADAEVRELLELMRLATARSWFFGVARRTEADLGNRIGHLVAQLENGEDRQPGE